MNRTRSRVVRTARQMISAVVMTAVLACAAPRATAAEHGSPYIGDPVLSPSKPSAPSKPAPPGAPTLRVPGHGPNSADLDPYFQVPGGGQGIEASIGHVAGETVGREESLTHINLQPYVFVEQNMLFSDLRMYRLNEGGQGFNIGLGLRRYFEQHDAIFGAVAYYDIDKTRRQQFQQLGLSLEMLTRWWDLRANWYIPTGDTEQILGTGFVQGSQRFEEHFLLVDTTTLFGNAAEGVDVTGTVPIPWEFLQPYNVEASAGFYHFQVRDRNLPDMWGYRLRADASFFKRMLHTYVELTHDEVTETNVIFGASLDYFGGFQNRNRYKDRQYYRMSEFVRRNFNVVTITSTVITRDVPVINPIDNEPYFFVHIDNTDEPDLNNGTFEDPFDSIIQAFDEFGTDADVYLVHGGSTFSGDEATLVVPEGTILLGENVPGRPQTIPAVGLGQLPLPTANPGAGPVTLTGSTGTTIDGTNARIVGAFTIIDPGEHGLLVSGPSAFGMPQLFRDLDIRGADGDGVRFENASGNYTLQRVTVQADDGIDGAGGVAFHVLGGNATITATDVDSNVMTDPTFENSGGNPNEIILIENITGGSVNLTDTTANDTGGGGIRLLNNAGNIAIGEALLTDIGQSPNPVGSGAGVEVFGGTGNITFFDDITVTNAAGVGFLVDSLAESGQVNVAAAADIIINERNTVGAEFRNIAGTVNFSPTLTTGTVPASSLTIGPLNTATNTFDPAVWFHSSTGDVSLNNVSIANSNSDGILIGSNLDGIDDLDEQNIVTIDPDTGAVTRPRFIATGTTNINSTGNVAALGTAAIRIQGVPLDPVTNPFGEAANVEFRNNVNINTRVDRGVQIVDTSGRLQFSGTTTVNNNAVAQSPRAGLFINDSISTITFGTFTTNDTIAGEPAVEIHNMPRPGAVGFNVLNILNAQGDGADVPGGDGDLTQGLPEDTTGLLVSDVSSLTIADGTIEVEDGIAVDIQRVYPQDDRFQVIDPTTGQLVNAEVVRDNLGRPVVLDANRNPVAVLDPQGNPILDSNGNNVIPSIFSLSTFPGYQVRLTEVNAIATSPGTAQSFGIFLSNNTGRFEVAGVEGIQGSGGEISGSTIAGLFANDADQVIIRHQDYIGNDIGLVFEDMNENILQGFLLDTLRVQDSIQEAVLATNIRNITIVDSLFQNNGFVDLDPDPDGELYRDTIAIFVTQRPDDPFDPDDEDNPLAFPYTYTIDRNQFLDLNTTSGSDAVRIQTVAGFARGSLLTLFFRDNDFLTFDRDINVNDTPKLLNVIWNGTIDALISGNDANILTSASPRGFEIRQTDGDSNLSQVVVRNNTLRFNNSTNAVGTFFDFVGTARIDLLANDYDMGGGGSTAALFRLLGVNNDVEIADNIFTFGGFNGIGVDVQQVVGPSFFLINGNAIDAANIGFRFQTTIGDVFLSGNVDNFVNANTTFTPLNNPSIFGSFLINGVRGPN
jgi:hypothetical protein